LGDEFLRHVERTSVLLHLIDVYNEDVVKAYKTIMTELKEYKVDLSTKSQIVALTKVEGFDKKDLSKKLSQLKKVVPKNTPVRAVSSTASEGIADLLRELRKIADKAQVKEKSKLARRIPVIGLRISEDSWAIKKDGDKFVVTGRKIERFARRTNFGEFYSEQRLRDIMRKMGIASELNKQGIKPGQKVRFGSPKIGQIDY
jgi:GTP-binding protein